ncbi:Asp/Glu racemase [Arenibaculum sp.]|uniref:maleate cis-trans isomerase family protein n=1 Tax=Arenibaculum sp. TaxID=2865862 RepID=UPI002E1472FD|nr:Asp/Glu racemase [Arenibaculum sp.]
MEGTMVQAPAAPAASHAAGETVVLPFDTDEGIAARAAIGLLVLATDQTIEHEWRFLLNVPGVAVYNARLWNDKAITPETLVRMEGDIAPTARLILPELPLGVVAFGCTSGSMVIGPDRVGDFIREARPGIATTTPVEAVTAALTALKARRIGLVAPYNRAVCEAMRDHFVAAGFEVPRLVIFDETDDTVVARITTGAISAAVREAARHPDVEAVFVSCTSLRVAEIAESLEAEIGMPVTSSNHALAWHSLRLAGVGDALPGRGRLFRTPL